MVNENGIDSLEVITENGNTRLSNENNRIVAMLNRKENDVDVDEINNSDGIIVSDATYGKPHYRFEFIPTI